jgi:aryl-alcohol dehydrogenase-like predicted oxidoreductase
MTSRTRKIGALEVTVVGVGCNNLGRELDAAETREVVHSALDTGITFFDTSDSYGRPKATSKSLLGEILKPHRDRVAIATKSGRQLDEAPNTFAEERGQTLLDWAFACLLAHLLVPSIIAGVRYAGQIAANAAAAVLELTADEKTQVDLLLETVG